MTNSELTTLFFLQMAVIIATCQLVGWAVRRWLGQPQVVGEMIAGVLLGPTLFGALAPTWQAALFPADSKALLYMTAQLGVGLYMFLVGLDFDRAGFRGSARSATAVSLAGIVVPFAVAAALVVWVLPHDSLFRPGVGATQASLFLGAAIAITAFPMLAQIIHERGMTGSRLGTLALAAGAIGDAAAWIVVAIVLASVGAGQHVAVKAIIGGLAFALVMATIAPRLLAPLGARAEQEGSVAEPLLARVLILFLLAAFAMDWAGIHAVFGGFLLGVAMPRGVLTHGLRQRLEPFSVTFLLPAFFTYSGLATDLGVLADLSMLGVALILLAASMLGKLGACYVAARMSGEAHDTALGIGALMNARGLMELIIITIGLERGIITPALYAMLVLMAIATTLMATPLFELLYARKRRGQGAPSTV